MSSLLSLMISSREALLDIPTSRLPIDVHGVGNKSAKQDLLERRRLEFFRDTGPA